MKNTTKLIALTFLMSASCAPLFGMENNQEQPSLPRPNLPEEDDSYNPPGSPNRRRQCPPQEPIYAAAKQAASAARNAALHAHWALHGMPEGRVLFPDTQDDDQNNQ